MMNKLQVLSLDHIKRMACEIDEMGIQLSITVGVKTEEFNSEKHSYPISQKSTEILLWIDAILEFEE